MFPPSTTQDKEQTVDGETEYQRRRQGCKLQKDYTLEHVDDMTPEGGWQHSGTKGLEARRRRHESDGIRLE